MIHIAESEKRGHTAKIRFSPVHRGHVDANKRVDDEKVPDKSGHHQEQSPGYDGTAAEIPVRKTGGTGWVDPAGGYMDGDVYVDPNGNRHYPKSRR